MYGKRERLINGKVNYRDESTNKSDMDRQRLREIKQHIVYRDNIYNDNKNIILRTINGYVV